MSGLIRIPVMMFATAVFCATAAEPKPLTVCDALDTAASGQQVTIRGDIVGSIHGLFLTEGINADPCPGWRLKYFTAPSMIGLEFTSSYGVKLTLEEEHRNLNLMVRLRRLCAAGQSKRCSASVTGVFVRTRWPIIFRRSNGSYYGFGLDPSGAFLATVVIKSFSIAD